MINTTTKKMNVLFLLTIIVHGSSVAMMEQYNNIVKGIKHVFHMPLNGALSEIQATGITIIAPCMVLAGGLFASQHSNIADDSKFLPALGITTLAATGVTYKLMNKLTLQSQYDQCKHEVQQLEKNKILKKFSALSNNTDIIAFFNKNINSANLFVHQDALQYINGLGKRTEILKNKLKMLAKFKNASTPVVESKENFSTNVAGMVEPLSVKVKNLNGTIKRVRGVLRNDATRKINVKNVEINEKKFHLKNKTGIIATFLNGIAVLAPAISQIILDLYVRILNKYA